MFLLPLQFGSIIWLYGSAKFLFWVLFFVKTFSFWPSFLIALFYDSCNTFVDSHLNNWWFLFFIASDSVKFSYGRVMRYLNQLVRRAIFLEDGLDDDNILTEAVWDNIKYFSLNVSFNTFLLNNVNMSCVLKKQLHKRLDRENSINASFEDGNSLTALNFIIFYKCLICFYF